MGLNFLGSSSAYDESGFAPFHEGVTDDFERPSQRPPNPNPRNFTIEDWESFGVWLVLKVTYPDCTNYEGRKILVYKNATLEDLRRQGHLDPHFAGNKKWLSPFARFEPTPDGWDKARVFALAMSQSGM